MDEDGKSKFDKASPEEKWNFCRKYVGQNKYLYREDIRVNEGVSVSKIKVTHKTIEFFHLKIPNQRWPVVQCPVIFNDSLQRGKEYVYFKLVYYRNESEPNLHTFILANSTKKGNKNIHIEALGKLNLNHQPAGSRSGSSFGSSSKSSSDAEYEVVYERTIFHGRPRADLQQQTDGTQLNRSRSAPNSYHREVSPRDSQTDPGYTSC